MLSSNVRINANSLNKQISFVEKIKSVQLLECRIDSIFRFDTNTNLNLPFYSSSVSAGFPSPADDHIEKKLDLNEYLVKHPAATFFVRAKGDSMINAGINDNDILVVDRSIEPTNGKIVIAAIDGQLTVKRLKKIKSKIYLVAENENFPAIELKSENDVCIWGVVTSVIHAV